MRNMSMKMKKKTFSLLVLALMMGIVLSGCEEGAVKPAPRNITQYRQMGRADRQRYTTQAIVRYNITFILNNERVLQERLDSLALVKKIVDSGYRLDNASMDELAMLLQDKACPPELSQRVLTFLLAENYSDIAAHVIPLMQKMQQDPKLRKLIIGWLKNNPVPEMLGGIVRSWALEGGSRSAGERGYRDTVQEITGKTWDVALLDAINTPGFHAAGDAFEILSKRMSPTVLRKRIVALTPRSDAIKALQVFIDQFGYLPSTNTEFVSELVIYKVRRDMIRDAAKQSVEWEKNYGYKYNIRDFHLLSRLARDPLRNNLNRTQLVLEVGKALKRRRHVKHTATDVKYDEGFWRQVDKLTMVDLWNIYLLDEMLSRPRDQIYWKIFADGDLDDKNSAWGGLIFYRNGQAEAHIYPPNPEALGNDLIYPPSRKLLTDSRDAMCRFTTHFDKVRNAGRAGPDARELADAKANNYYGMVFTRISPKKFCVHYFNPKGVVISLGTFPFRENRSK